MPSAQDVYITPASSVIDIYSGSTKNLYLSGSTHGYIHGASDLKITADDDISLIGGGGGSIVTFGVGGAEKMRLAETGKFGIGTTAPAQSLDVRGTTLLSGATDTVPFEVFAYGAGTSALHVTSGSNTGLGTATPLAKLHINASAYQMVFQRDTHHHTIVKGNSDDTLIFATGAPGSHTTRFKIQPTGIDVVNNATITGNVGIGTNSPGALLDIHQNADDSALEIAGYDDKSGVTAKLHVRSNGISRFQGSTDAQVQSAAGSIYLSSSEHLYLDNGTRNTYSTIFRDGTGEYARFKNARLGIGTAAPDYPLDVYHDSSSFVARFTNTSSNGYIMKLVASDSSLSFQTDHIIPTYNMHLGNDNVNWYIRTAGYKLGVGTSSPKTSMSLVGALSILERADHETTNADWGQLWVKNDSPNKLYFTDDAGTDHDLTAGGGTIGGSLSDNYIPIGSAANTVSNFVLGLTENNSIWIGSDPTSTTNDAYYNNAFGTGALDAITTGDYNDAFGYNALGATTGGGRNTAMGYAAMNANTGGTNNVALGMETLRDGTGHTYNTAVGYNAMLSMGGNVAGNVAVGGFALYYPSGNYNTAIGYKAISGAAAGTRTAYQNVGIGQEVLGDITSGYYNVAIGVFAGTNMTTGHNNIAIGPRALNDATTATNNVAIGSYAATGMTDGQYNVAVGQYALQENTQGDENVAVGYYALYNLNPAAGAGDSVGVGATAGFSTTTGVQNVFIGKRAGYNNTTGSNAVIIGREAGYNSTLGGDNTYIGMRTGYTNTEGEENTFVGMQAGYSVASAGALQGSFNTFIGFKAAYSYAGGVNYGSNVAIGHQTLMTGTNANRTVALGNSAGISGTASVDNVLVGYGAGSYADSTGNTYVGNKAGFRSNGNYNTAVGFRALSGSSSGDTSHLNVAIGYLAMEDSTSAQENVAVGSYAGGNLTTGDYNTFVGYAVARYVTQAKRNVALGYAALNQLSETTDTYNVAVGMYSAMNLYTGSHNVAVGYEALRANASSDNRYMVAIGHGALYSVAGTDYNVAIGYVAGSGTTTGDKNIYIGALAGRTGSTASQCVSIGHEAGRLNDTTNNVVAVGYQAAYSNTGGNIVAMGTQALHDNTTGTEGLAIGYQASRNNTVAHQNVALGHQTLFDNESGSKNIAIGYRAMYEYAPASAVDGMNVAVGYQALLDQTTAVSNIGIGHQAGQNVTTGGYSVYIGDNAGRTITDAISNVMIGYQAGYPLGSSASANVIVGANAAVAGDSALSNSVIIGQEAGYSAGGSASVGVGKRALYYPHGNYNTAIGNQAMYGNASTTTAQQNIAMGRRALFAAQSAQYNAALGYQAGYSTTTGYSNVFLGHETGYSNTTGAGNTYLGNQAGYSGSTGNNAVFIGNAAGLKNTSNDNVAIGAEAYLSGSSATNIVAIGRNAGKGITTGVGIVAIGNNAVKENDSGTHNIGIGWQALMGATGVSNRNIGIGTSALLDVTTGDDNVGVGYQAINNVTTGEYNVAVGSNALNDLTTTSNNVAIGFNAGHETTTADNVWVGYQAGYHSESSGSVAVGKQAGYYPHGNHNTFIGFKAGMGDSSTTTAYNNVAVGKDAGTSITSALANVLVGVGAGYGITTAQKSVVIGHNAGYAMAGQGGSVLIGYEAGRLQDAGSGGSVAIGHQALYSGTQNYQDVAIGINAGRKATGASASNVFLGRYAGPSTAGVVQNKLYINNAEGTPLIYGDFSAPSVTINGTLDMPTNHGITFDNTNNNNQYFISNRGSNAATLVFGIGAIDNANAKITMDGDGDLGIGTTAPDEKLDVRGDIQLKQTGDTAVTVLGDANRSGADSHIAALRGKWNGTAVGTFMVMSGPDTTNKDDGQLTFQTASAGTLAERMRIDETGNIGIGTTSPDYKLDVRKSGHSVALISGAGNGTYPVMHVIDSADTEVAWFEGNRAGDTGAYIGVRHWPASATENARSGIKFQSKDDGGALTNYASIVMRINDYTGGTEDGTLRFNVMADGTETEELKIDKQGLYIDTYTRLQRNSSTNGLHLTDSGGNAVAFSTVSGATGGFNFDNTTTNKIYRSAGTMQYNSTETHSFNNNIDITSAKTISASTTPVAQIKDDTGFIMQDNQGIKSASAALDQWPLDAGTGKATAQVQGYSKIQNITTAGIDPASVPSFEVKLPTAAVGTEYVIVFGTSQANLSGKSLTLIANGSDVIHSGSSTPSSITFAKHTGESIHFIAFEANRWKVLSHT